MTRSHPLLSIVLCALVAFPSAVAGAEELDAIFGKVNELVGKKNYPKALEELSWAEKEIQKLHNQRLQEFFPNELAGFTGGKTEAGGAMGFSSVERRYTKGSTSVSVALLGGGGSALGGMGGLAAIGQMAAAFGGTQPGMDTFRIAGNTATLQVKNNSAELSVFLSGGSILKLEMQNGKDGEALKSMANALKLSDLDTYLKGAA